MQIPNISRYLLSSFVELVLKVLKFSNSPRVWSLGVGNFKTNQNS